MQDCNVRRLKKFRLLVIVLVILTFGLGGIFVLGQGGTGREAPNSNVRTKPPSSPRKPTPRRKPTNENRTTRAETTRADAEGVYWEKIRTSSERANFKTYLQKFPNGRFTIQAGNSLRSLETPSSPEAKANTNSNAPYILGGLSGSGKDPNSNSKSVSPSILGGLSGSTLRDLKAGSILRNNLGMELVFIPAGSIKTKTEPTLQIEEFLIGRHEVTQAQWHAVMGNNPSFFGACGDNCPVEQMSWNDVQAFLQRLNAANDGFRYRLPTEAEWVHAARAGSTGVGAGDPRETAWFSDNSGGRTHPVGGKRPNAWGLYDMLGNVVELCLDPESERDYERVESLYKKGLTAKADFDRALARLTSSRSQGCGGSWSTSGASLRQALGRTPLVTSLNSQNGFRLVAIPRSR